MRGKRDYWILLSVTDRIEREVIDAQLALICISFLIPHCLPSTVPCNVDVFSSLTRIYRSPAGITICTPIFSPILWVAQSSSSRNSVRSSGRLVS